MKSILKRYLPIALIISVIVAAYFLGFFNYFSFEKLKKEREVLKNFVGLHPFLAPLLFIGLDILTAACSIPGTVIFLNLLSGFLFPQILSVLYIIIGETCGSTLLFLSVRLAWGASLNKRTKPGILLNIKKGFQKNAVNYMLFLRFVHLFPFWFVNIAPALFGIRLRTFMWTTCIGVIPGAIVYTQIGSDLGHFLDQSTTFSLNALFNTKMKIMLIALGLIAIIPIFFRKK